MSKVKNKIFIHIFVFSIMSATYLFCQQILPQKVVKERQLHLMASQYEINGQIELAAELYTQQCLNNPLDISSYVGAKRCLLKLNQYDRLYELIMTLQKTRRDIRYEVDLAEIEYLKGDTKKALTHWNRILDENSVREEAYIFVGQVFLDNQLYNEAIECYKKARNKLKNKSLFIFELAGIYTLLSEYELMTLEFLNYLENNPKQINYIDSRIVDLEKSGESIPKVIRTLEKEVKARKPLASQIHQLLGNIYTRTQNYEKAYDHLLALEEGLLSINDKKNGLYLYRFALITTRDNELEYARTAYESILNRFPKSIYVNKSRIGLAKILEHKGFYLEAVNTFERFVDSFPKSSEAVTALIRIGDIWYGELFDIAKAEKAYKRLINDYPKSPERKQALFKLGECAIISNNFDTAKNYYLQILLEYKNKTDINFKKAQYSLARLEFYRGFPSKSIQLLNNYFNTRINNPLNPDYYENDALELQMLIQDNKNDSTGLAIFALADVLKMQRKYTESENIVSDYIKNNPDKLIINDLELFLADLNKTQGNFEKALQTLNKVYLNEKNMYRDKALKKMAEIYDKDLNVKEKAVQSYETLLAIFPESIYIEEARKKIRILEK